MQGCEVERRLRAADRNGGLMKTDAEGLMDGSTAAISSAKGVEELWVLRDQLKAEGREIAVHACSDLIVRCSIDHRVDLAKAEGLARDLLLALPDKRHYLLLAGVLEAEGKGEEAAENRRLAAQSPNLHPQASEEHKKRAWEATLAAERSSETEPRN